MSTNFANAQNMWKGFYTLDIFAHNIVIKR